MGLGSRVTLDKLISLSLSFLPFLPCKMVGVMAVPFVVAVGVRYTRMYNICQDPGPSRCPLLLGTLVFRQPVIHFFDLDIHPAWEGCPFLWLVSFLFLKKILIN